MLSGTATVHVIRGEAPDMNALLGNDGQDKNQFIYPIVGEIVRRQL